GPYQKRRRRRRMPEGYPRPAEAWANQFAREDARMTSIGTLATTGRTGQRRTNPWLVLVIVCMADFMVILDSTIVNVALPSIQKGLDFSLTDLQWVVNIYTLFFGGLRLLGGRSGDLFGRQRLFVTGLAVFTFASFLNGVAQDSGVLIAGRA